MVPILPFLRPRLPESRVHGPGPSAHSNHTNRSWAKDPMFLLAVLANTFQGFAYFIPLIWLPSMLFIYFWSFTCILTFARVLFFFLAFASELDLSASDASLTLAVLNGKCLRQSERKRIVDVFIRFLCNQPHRNGIPDG